jgi:hypothetical protein
MDKSILTSFAISILLLFLGCNFVFNTRKTIAKYSSLSKNKENSYFNRLLSSDSNRLWLKIVGVVLLILVMAIVYAMIGLLLNKK